MKRKKMMQNKATVKYIDKTEQLEKGIKRFPSIYIEGSAACGKTTAVKMLLQKHPEEKSYILDLALELRQQEELLEKLRRLKGQMETEPLWLVLENMLENPVPEVTDLLKEIVRTMQPDGRVIFVSRNKPWEQLLDLLWKEEMEMIPMEKLLFSREEIRSYLRMKNLSINGKGLYEKTGGWPGCISVLTRMAEMNRNKTIEELMDSHEIKIYIQKEILSCLSLDEKQILARIAGFPWVNEKLLEEVWNIENGRHYLEGFQRKGLLVFERGKRRWKLAPLLQNYVGEQLPVTGQEHLWYEKHLYIPEVFFCLKKAGEEQLYQEYLRKYYSAVFFAGLISEELLKRTENTPRDCYLRGVYYYTTRQFSRLQSEIDSLKQIEEKDFETKEILLNLCYLNPQMALEEWLQLLKELLEENKKFKMYQMLGNSVTYLCGTRDLSGLFACSSKEEKKNAHLWKKAFGELEWKCYQLARIDYYVETERKELLSEDDLNVLRNISVSGELWQIRLVKLYLLCKMQRMQYDERYTPVIGMLEQSLLEENEPVCVRITECISSLYAPWYGAKEKMSRWLRYAGIDSMAVITEENYVPLYFQAKGYIVLNQFERAEKILKKLVPYLLEYRRSRFLAEVLFQYAVINWSKNIKGQTVKNAIESFMNCGKSRYVAFYAGYGKKGLEVLEAYIEWHKGNFPERWSHKKKYNYGNVLRMPQEDYFNAVLRNAKKVSKNEKKFPEEHIEEHLTMTETLILQDIGRGLSNQEICVELGVKMPTVKGHIYNLYKKLGVNSRGQAIVKGKELGILE